MLIPKFRSQGAEVEFEYLGNDRTKANVKVKELLLQEFDALMVFDPTDSLHDFYSNYSVPLQYDVADFGISIYNTPKHEMLYSDNLKINFYDLAKEKSLIWASSLQMTIDPSKNRKYKIIAKKLSELLQSSNILK